MFDVLIHDYPYLLSSLNGLPAVILAFIIFRKHKAMMGLSGLLFIFLSPTALIYQGVYWAPERLGGVQYGLEDVVCSFSFGSIIYLASVLAFPSSSQKKMSALVFLKRLSLLGPVGALVFFALLFMGIGSMAASIGSFILIWLIVVLKQRNLIRPSLLTAFFYIPYYSFIILITTWISPEYLLLWNGIEIWGPKMFSVPIEDFIWVFTLSACYGAFIYSVRLNPTK